MKNSCDALAPTTKSFEAKVCKSELFAFEPLQQCLDPDRRVDNFLTDYSILGD